MTKLRDKLATLEKDFKAKEIELNRQLEEYKEAVEKNQALYEEAKEEADNIRKTLKNRDHDASVKAASHTSDVENIKNGYESQIQILNQNLELREAAMNNLRKENRSLIEQVEDLKKENAELETRASKGSQQVVSQVNDLQDRLRLSETNSTAFVIELKEENERLKKELSLLQKSSKASQDVEKEVGQLSIENETLKKQVRELTARASNAKVTADNQQAKENEELKKKVKDLQKNMKKTEDDLIDYKVKICLR